MHNFGVETWPLSHIRYSSDSGSNHIRTPPFSVQRLPEETMDQSLQFMFVFISIHPTCNKTYRHIFYHKFSQVKRDRDLDGNKHLQPGRKRAWNSAHCMPGTLEIVSVTQQVSSHTLWENWGLVIISSRAVTEVVCAEGNLVPLVSLVLLARCVVRSVWPTYSASIWFLYPPLKSVFLVV